ncbi:hypothetical protein DICPUDRAFT_147427 [Dictyostelium purpureum]|uniref:Uncharacterized protein n=1 Tax=Dictyostelium purpureum TaxID=5786 RepID=F0Z8G3_DICPU|nr:uncharacterized protein DICPUDRAFT_147427 [Dictyostelium purpureum]EGC39720.1 hypothetical protein DICPUDRAFT_147427 [Dictyostelium purpureum]|eukprot:XP_003283706.1 hypothetical protein DICPUDRAFT_147427 [Dictyostelium purpureum]
MIENINNNSDDISSNISNSNNSFNIENYYKIVNDSITKFNDILDSIIEDSQEKLKENQILREELLNVIQNKILKLEEKESILKNQKIQLLKEIELILVELDLQPNLFTSDSDIKNQYAQLIDSFNTTKLISSQIILIDAYHTNLKNIYNENKNKLNKLFEQLNHLYDDLGLNEDKSALQFKEIGLPSNKRIQEFEIEIQRLKEIQNGIIDKLLVSKSSVIKLKEELELSNEESAEINNLINQLNKINNSSDQQSKQIKSLVQILYKLESMNKDLSNLKNKRVNQISKLSNTIDKDYIQLGIESNDEFRIKFQKEKESTLKKHSSVSPKLINCLLVESERLLELKKLKFKDQFDSKLKILENLWEQLCIPKENRNLKSIINNNNNNKEQQEEQQNDQDSQNDKNQDRLDIENNNSYYYNLETLELVNKEIEYLTGLLASMKVILEKVKRREWIKSEMKKFENSASDSNRFKGSSVRLLEEAKFRKTISREFPKLTEDLVRELAEWEGANNKRFFYYGEPYLDLMNSETERPDFDLLHLKLLTKKDHISEGTSNGQAAVSYVNIDSTTTNSNKNTTTPNTPTQHSKKPVPLIKRPSLSSLPTSNNSVSSSPKAVSPTSKLSKTLSSINFSTTTSTTTTKPPTLKPSSSPSSLSTSTNSLTNTPSKLSSSSPSIGGNITPIKKESSTKSLHGTTPSKNSQSTTTPSKSSSSTTPLKSSSSSVGSGNITTPLKRESSIPKLSTPITNKNSKKQ